MLRFLLLLPALAALCRYTVRDVAFVDLGDDSYRLELRIPDPDAATLGAVATTLLDTNVTYEVDELEDLSSESSKATLHHPDGSSLDVDLWAADALDAFTPAGIVARVPALTAADRARAVLDEARRGGEATQRWCGNRPSRPLAAPGRRLYVSVLVPTAE